MPIFADRNFPCYVPDRLPRREREMRNLVRLGWVEEQAISGHRRYRINMENPKVRALHEFFEKVGYL